MKVDTADDMLIKLLDHLPAAYSELKSVVDFQDPATLTIDNLKEKVRNFYHRSIEPTKKGGDKGEKKEKNMAMVAYKKAFKGNCSNCNVQGHKAKDCPDKKKAARSTATTGVEAGKQKRDLLEVVCYKCDKKGHYSRNCPDMKKAADGSANFAGYVGMTVMDDRCQEPTVPMKEVVSKNLVARHLSKFDRFATWDQYWESDPEDYEVEGDDKAFMQSNLAIYEGMSYKLRMNKLSSWRKESTDSDDSEADVPMEETSNRHEKMNGLL